MTESKFPLSFQELLKDYFKMSSKDEQCIFIEIIMRWYNENSNTTRYFLKRILFGVLGWT